MWLSHVLWTAAGRLHAHRGVVLDSSDRVLPAGALSDMTATKNHMTIMFNHLKQYHLLRSITIAFEV